MAKRYQTSAAKTLEQYRVALDNVEKQTEVASVMAELGYGAALIKEGKALLAKARSAYDLNQTEDDETSAAYADFNTKKEKLKDTFTLHRKKARVIFRKDPLTADKLAISGSFSRIYINWLEATRKFYTLASTDSTIQSKLARLKISKEELEAVKASISSLEAARSEYLREKGESQEATKAKDTALAAIDDWMSEFYAIARIGLEDKPQLLEVLGKKVIS